MVAMAWTRSGMMTFIIARLSRLPAIMKPTTRTTEGRHRNSFPPPSTGICIRGNGTRGKIAGAYVNSAFVKTDAVRAGFDEAIVLNADGHISEGSAANFFMLRNGILSTPPTTANVLEGITRRTVIQLTRDELKMEVQEREIDRTELYLADEAFYCGTGAQISAITAVDHRPIGTGEMGDITARLRKLYFDVVRGKVAKYREWCHPVYELSQKRTSKERTHVTVE